MTSPPVCLRLYKSELEIIRDEISKLKRLQTASQLLGLPIAGLGILSLFFPNLLGSNITIDNLSKFSTVILGGVFFASINFFNKGDLLSLRKRKNDLEIFIVEYDNYETKGDFQKQQIYDECEKIIQKRKGL